MQTSNKATSHVIESSRDEQRVEVVLEQHEGVERVALRCSTWTDGLGWCTQKTIRLDGDQLDDLQHAITVARHRLRRHRADAGHAPQTAQVIQLPTLA
ncbi:MAG TPA: hypothetical protein VF666_07625 [Pyrinomonadaceae bacterium]